MWNDVEVDLRNTLLRLAGADARLQGVDAQICQLQRNDPFEHGLSDLQGAYGKAADEVAAVAQRVGEILRFASPLACLLHDARPLVLFATGSLRLLGLTR